MSDTMHPSPHELQQMLSEAKSLEWGSPRQLPALAALRACCPAFVPGLLTSSRAMLWGKEDVENPAAFFNEVEQILHHALEASDREPGALVGMARFMSVVRDSPQAAEPLYREAVAKALDTLEEAWAGLIEALGEQEKTEDAARTAEFARKVFPRSEQLSEACRYAKVTDCSIKPASPEGSEHHRKDWSMSDKLGVLIAERRLECRDGAGNSHDIVLRIGKPELDQDPNPAWYCPFTLTGPNGELERRASGEDSFQALLLGLQMIGVVLEHYARTHACTLTWHEIGMTDPGFPPLPKPTMK